MQSFLALALAATLFPVVAETAPVPGVATQKASLDPDVRELASYTLTMDTFHKVDRATRAIAVEMKKDPRYIEQQKLKAEMKALGEKDEPTEADDKRRDAITARLEELEASSPANMNDARTISEMAARLQGEPRIAAALQAEGLTAREYAKFLFAALQGGLAAGLQKMGVKEIPEGTNPANVKFMQDHEEDFKKMQSAWDKN